MISESDREAAFASADAATAQTVADLARLLRRLRRREARRRGDSPLTYRELAAKTGWAHSVIGLYLNGQALPPTDRFDVLVQLLGAHPTEQAALATARDLIEEQRYVGTKSGTDRPRQPARGVVGTATPGGLPAPPRHFTGRHRELQSLTSLLRTEPDDSAVVCAIGGTAGVGKTSMALHWARQIAGQFPDGQLYVNLRGFDPANQVMDPAEAVHCLLDAMQVAPQRMPATLEGKTALYRGLLAGKRMLIVLDNARDTSQVRPLLPGAAPCLVIVTSRNQLSGLVATEGAHPVTLDLLHPDEARTLLAHRLGNQRVAAEPAAAAEIVARCARLPLALVVAAARIAAKPDVGLAAFAAELRDSHHRWAMLTGDDPATDVHAVLTWSYQTLRPPAARLLRLLGLHPGPDFTATTAASLAGITPSAVGSLLAELTQAHLLVEHSSGRYALHDLLREYAAELAREDAGDHRDAAYLRMLDHYLHSAYAASRLLNPHGDPISLDPPTPDAVLVSPVDQAEAQEWLHAEHPVLTALFGAAAYVVYHAHAWRLASALAVYLDRRARWHDWRAIAHTALASAQRAGDFTAQAQAHRYLARASIHLNQFDLAEAQLRCALDIASRHRDLADQAHTQLCLSDLRARTGQTADALAHAELALDQYEAAGHVRGQADALNTVGWHHALMGEHRAAIGYCERALALHAEFGPGIVAAATWDSLGYAHHQLGDYPRAIACYQQAIELFVDLDVRYEEAASWTRLGQTQHTVGNHQAAREAWQRALAILDEIDHPEADQVRGRLSALDPRASSTGSRGG